jgi:hypothetical protein
MKSEKGGFSVDKSNGKQNESGKLHYVRVPSDDNRNLFQNYPHIRPRSGYFQTGQLNWYGKLLSCGEHPDDTSVVLECESLALNENLESVRTGLGRLVRTCSQDDVKRSVDEILHQSMRANHFVDVSQAIERLNLVAIPSHADARLRRPVAHLNVLSHKQRVNARSFEECFVFVHSLRG